MAIDERLLREAANWILTNRTLRPFKTIAAEANVPINTLKYHAEKFLSSGQKDGDAHEQDAPPRHRSYGSQRKKTTMRPDKKQEINK